MSAPVHDPEKHYLERTQSRMDSTLSGHKREWTQSRMGTIRMNVIPNEHFHLCSFFVGLLLLLGGSLLQRQEFK